MNMKKFQITLSQRDGSYTPIFHECIEADDLIELLSKFVLSIAKLKKMLITTKELDDDDIPF